MPFHDDPSRWARPVAPERTLASVDLPGRQRVLLEAERALTGEPGSAAIVGAAGVGMGTIAREAARRLAASGWSVYEAASGEAIAGLPYIGELEGRLAALAQDDGRVLWLLPDVQAALSAGTYRENPNGLLDRLVPMLAAGRLRLLAPCTPAEWEAVVGARPVIRTLLAPLRLEPAGDEDTRARELDVRPDTLEQERPRVLAAFDGIAARLADGRPYLFGERFTAADLTFSALAAAAVVPPGYGTPLPQLDVLPEPVARDVRAFREHPAGAFALRIYERHRRAAAA